MSTGTGTENELWERIGKALKIAYGGSTDGGHHKQWVIDQMVRALTGCPVETVTARDYKGREYRYEAQGESDRYREWVAEHNAGQDGPDTYWWDTGTPP